MTPVKIDAAIATAFALIIVLIKLRRPGRNPRVGEFLVMGLSGLTAVTGVRLLVMIFLTDTEFPANTEVYLAFASAMLIWVSLTQAWEYLWRDDSGIS